MDEKWYFDYIDGIDISKIEYFNINDEELKSFYNENGYLIDKNYFILSDDGNYSWLAPRGMHYLQFNRMPGLKYIIGTIDNNIKKKTIISALAYVDDYILFSDQRKFITYFSTVETNMYFRKRGLFKDLIKNSYCFINPEQHILISGESNMGKKSNVINNTINIYRNLGFSMDIRTDSCDFEEGKYYNLLKNSGYIKVKKR